MSIKTVKDLKKALEEFDDDLPLVYAIDDEGNCFKYVYFEPQLGKFNENDFTAQDHVEKEEYSELEGKQVVCIN